MNNGVDFLDVYDKVYDEVLYYIKNKPEDLNNTYSADGVDDFFIIDYVEEDKLDDFLKINKYNFRKDSLVVFDTMNFLKQNIISYNFSKENIWRQFDHDCPRTEIIINNELVTGKNQFIEKLKFYKSHNVTIGKYQFDLLAILAMISNQSSYAFPYNFLYKIHSYYDENLIITNCTNNRNISFNFNKDCPESLKIKIETNMLLRHLWNKIEPTELNIVLLIELNTLNSIDGNGIFSKNGIFLINSVEKYYWDSILTQMIV